MRKFSKGDRVRMSYRRDRVPFGTIGTVVLIDSHAPYVEWDNWNNGHSGPFRDGRQTVWAVANEFLELIQPADTASHNPIEPDGTFRDRMAMAALAGFGAHPSNPDKPEEIAKYCYGIADAMLKERAGK